MGYLVESTDIHQPVEQASELIKQVLKWAEGRGLCKKGQRATIMHGAKSMDTEHNALISIQVI